MNETENNFYYIPHSRAFVEAALAEHELTGKAWISPRKRAEIAAQFGLEEGKAATSAYLAGHIAVELLDGLELDLLDLQMEGNT